jgi:ferredoxin
MILYFTATGNSLAVARKIADATGDALFDMGKAYKAGDFDVTVKQGGQLGFVFPTYRWSTPPLVDEFVKRVSFATPDGAPYRPDYCFSVETCGYLTGRESAFFARLLSTYQNLRVDAAYSVKSVGNCLYLFDTPSDSAVASTLEAADGAAARVAELVLARHRGETVHANPLGAAMSLGTCHEGKKRSVASFRVDEDACVGCGTCARACSTNTIYMVDGHPVWRGDGCTECLACIHRCPHDASQHGKATEGRRRYLNPIMRG